MIASVSPVPPRILQAIIIITLFCHIHTVEGRVSRTVTHQFHCHCWDIHHQWGISRIRGHAGCKVCFAHHGALDCCAPSSRCSLYLSNARCTLLQQHILFAQTQLTIIILRLETATHTTTLSRESNMSNTKTSCTRLLDLLVFKLKSNHGLADLGITWRSLNPCSGGFVDSSRSTDVIELLSLGYPPPQQWSSDTSLCFFQVWILSQVTPADQECPAPFHGCGAIQLHVLKLKWSRVCCSMLQCVAVCYSVCRS